MVTAFSVPARFLLLLAVLGWCGRAGAVGEAVRLDEMTTELSLTPYVSLFRDPSGRMTWDEVRRQWAQGQFTLGDDLRPSLGFTADAIWIRFRIAHHGPATAVWIVELETPRLDSVDGFLLRSGGPPRHFAAGNLRVPSPELMESVRPALPISLQPGEEVEFLLRVQSETALLLPLSIRSPSRYAAAQADLADTAAGYFGYLKALIVLSLIFGVITRERNMVTYALAMAGGTTFYLLMSGHWTWSVWPAREFFLKQGMMLAGSTGIVLMIVFMRGLVDLRRNLPRVDWWTVRLIWINAAFALVLLFLPYRVGYQLFLTHALVMGLAVCRA